MGKSLFEQMGGTYHQEGDYFLPDLPVPEVPAIGIWGQRRRRYLKEHRQPLYTALLLSGKLDGHLSEIDIEANSMFFQLVEQMAVLAAEVKPGPQVDVPALIAVTHQAGLKVADVLVRANSGMLDVPALRKALVEVEGAVQTVRRAFEEENVDATHD